MGNKFSGSDGDLVIGRAVITGKYINVKGEHCCEVALWAVDLGERDPGLPLGDRAAVEKGEAK